MGTKKTKRRIKPLYTIKELADRCGLSRHQVRRMLDGLSINYVRIGNRLLVPLSELFSKLPQLAESERYARMANRRATAENDDFAA